MRYQVKGMVFRMNQKSTIIVVLTLIMMVTVYQIGESRTSIRSGTSRCE